MKLNNLAELTSIKTPLLLAQSQVDDTVTWFNIETDSTAILLEDFNKLLEGSDRPSGIFYLRTVIISDVDNPEIKLNSIAGICIYRKDGKGQVEFMPESIQAQDENWVEFFRVNGDVGYVPDTLVMDGLENSEHHRTLLMDLWNRAQKPQ